jgi:hypothetical protein
VFIQAPAGTQALVAPRTKKRIQQLSAALLAVIKVRHNITLPLVPPGARHQAKSLGN